MCLDWTPSLGPIAMVIGRNRMLCRCSIGDYPEQVVMSVVCHSRSTVIIGLSYTFNPVSLCTLLYSI
jgi:hypothetical protein